VSLKVSDGQAVDDAGASVRQPTKQSMTERLKYEIITRASKV